MQPGKQNHTWSPLGVFYKKRCSEKFSNNHRKTPVSKFLFYNVAALSLQLHQRETPTQVFSCEYCEIFKSTYFGEHLRTAASGFIYLCIYSFISLFKIFYGSCETLKVYINSMLGVAKNTQFIHEIGKLGNWTLLKDRKKKTINPNKKC